MYEKHWGLVDKPFRNTPDPNYFYFSSQHEEALTRMLYCILEGQGGMMLSGEVGSGKTLLSRILIDELNPEKYECASIVHSNLDATELLCDILRQFGCNARGLDKPKMLGLLGDCFREHQRAGRSTVIIIDEAQITLDAVTLEEMRLLMNFQQDRKFSVTLLLLGQPEMRERIRQSQQFLQRLSVRYHLEALGHQDAISYLRHRLTVAGGKEEIFTSEAEELIATASNGVPRLINGLADMSLLAGYGKRAPLVDKEIVRAALIDMNK